MVGRKIIGEVKKELNSINFAFDEISLLNMSDSVLVLSIEYRNDSYIINYYVDGCKCVIDRYKEFTKNGIKMVNILAYTDKIIIYPDFYCGNEYRKLEKDDLKDDNIKNSMVKMCGDIFKIEGLLAMDYCDKFNKETLIYLMNKFDWSNNEGLCYIYTNFENIKLKLDRLEKGLVIKEFNVKNFVVSLENKEVFMYGMVDLEKAYLYRGVSDIYKIVGEEMFDGISDVDRIVDFIVRCVVDIYLYVTKEKNIDNINEYIERVVNGELYKKCKTLVEWY